MRSAEINTPPIPNRANNLLSNIHATQTTPHAPIDIQPKREIIDVRSRMDKAAEDHKQVG
jgi:hypothetical protein